MYQGYQKGIGMSLILLYSFQGHTCMHPQKTFMDHATRPIFLYNTGALCNKGEFAMQYGGALCDIGDALYDMAAP